MFLIASLWLLSSQKEVFMSKLEEFINELERAEKLTRDNKVNNEENEGNADIGGLGLKELIEEEERSKVKLA